MKKVAYIFFIVYSNIWSVNIDAQDMDTLLFTENLFLEDNLINVSLEFNLTQLIDEKDSTSYIPAKLKLYCNNGIKKESTVRIKARGEYRRNNCSNIPIWINIKEDTRLKGEYFNNVKRLKVTPRCKDSKYYENSLIIEYFAYKLFNLITEHSYRVRLVNLEYINTGKNNKKDKNIAILIEPEELIFKRINAERIQKGENKYKDLDSLSTAVVSMFQYMIGNTDFSIPGGHNIKIYSKKDVEKSELYAFPYDFDFSGLVNADYATPNRSFNIEKVTDRYFFGICRSDELYYEVIDLFQSKKQEVFDLINSLQFFDNKTRRQVRNYIEEFYAELDDPDFISKHIRTTCIQVNK